MRVKREMDNIVTVQSFDDFRFFVLCTVLVVICINCSSQNRSVKKTITNRSEPGSNETLAQSDEMDSKTFAEAEAIFLANYRRSRGNPYACLSVAV